MASILDYPPPPLDTSWYRWCYCAGLRGIPWEEILAAAYSYRKEIRPKDQDNYLRGLRKNCDPFAAAEPGPTRAEETQLCSFPEYPVGYRPPLDWAIPCTAECKPLVKWSKQRMTEAEAWLNPHCEILGKNLKGLQQIVIDIDGDHNGLDMPLIEYWSKYIDYTRSRVKWVNGIPVSYHLEFWTNQRIPTMHYRNLDILGNKNNQVQYLKPNKVCNNIPMAPFDETVWEDLQVWLKNSQS